MGGIVKPQFAGMVSGWLERYGLCLGGGLLAVAIFGVPPESLAHTIVRLLAASVMLRSVGGSQDRPQATGAASRRG
jgi:hypothetical protein